MAVGRAHTIHCPRCGGSIPLEDGPKPECPFCQARVTIPPWLARHQRDYRQAVSDLSRQAAEERSRAAAWQAISRATIGGTFLAVPLLLLALPVIAGVGGLALLARQGAIGPELARGLVAPVAAASGLLGLGLMLGYLLWGRERRRGLALGERAVACPSCAGLNRIAGGQAAHTCQYCGAALVPSKTVAMNVLAEAQAKLHRERLLRYRNERRARSRFTDWVARSFSFTGDVRLLLLGGLVALCVASAQARNTRQVQGVIAGWGGFLTVSLASLGVFLVRRARARRIEAACAELAGQFGGEVLRGRAEVLGWMDRLWAGPVLDAELSTSRYHRAVAARSQGYHLLLELQPASTWFGAISGHRRVLLRVAALLAPALPATPAIEGLRAWLRDAGFTVDAHEHGLVLRGSTELLARIRREPELLLALAPVVVRAGELARAAGAAAVEPLA
jgi:hypothetical protein